MAKVDGLSVAAKGLRGPAPNAAEVKQLFVQAAYQDLGFGLMLVERIVERGRRICYEKRSLDTIWDRMAPT